ncbi:MAG TPA: HD domain-containing phosphohydrolase [Phycisphaerae bacterium]|nr:HD domain-containing phosphohydrolase [Phycisphaerae bacterium]
MRILAVDDDPVMLELLKTALDQYGQTVVTASNGEQAIQLLDPSTRFVITDWMMEPVDGLELCRTIRRRPYSRYVYIIMLSSQDDSMNVAEAIAAGADDFITKPFTAAELDARIKAGMHALSLETRDVTIFALARLAESRDKETGRHLERVRNYVQILGQEFSKKPEFRDRIDTDFVQMLYQTSPLHDIGKVAIPDAVLLKPGSLTTEEFEIMKQHTTIGARTLGEVMESYPGAAFLQMARDIAATHHERFNGQGYPHGLAGEDIPFSGRIMAMADVYDATTSNRIYKKAKSHAQACEEIAEESGKHFDPRVVEAFFAVEPEILAAREHHLKAAKDQRSVLLPPTLQPAG